MSASCPYASGAGSIAYIALSRAQRARAATQRAPAPAPTPRVGAVRRSPAAAASADGGATPPPPPDIRKLAQLARLSVSDEEAAAWSPKIAAIVDWFGQLRDVPVDGVPPALRAAEGEQGAEAALRPDAVADFPARDALLQAAPRREAAYLYVPKIMGEADG